MYSFPTKSLLLANDKSCGSGDVCNKRRGNGDINEKGRSSSDVGQKRGSNSSSINESAPDQHRGILLTIIARGPRGGRLLDQTQVTSYFHKP